MDHVASLRAARLLVLQTEDHAAANNDGLQGKATKLHEGPQLAPGPTLG